MKKLSCVGSDKSLRYALNVSCCGSQIGGSWRVSMTGRIEASTIQKSGNRTMIRMASTPTMVSACPMMRRPLYRRGDIVIAHAAAGSPKIQQGGDYKGYKHNDTHRR